MTSSALKQQRHPGDARIAFAAFGIALLMIVGSTALDLPPLLIVAVIGALGLAAAVILRPFNGLIALVFGTQITGLIERVVPGGEWALEGVAALVVLGLVVTGHRQPRHRRFGPDALPLRLAGLFLLVLVVSALGAANADLAFEGLLKRVNLIVLLWLVVRLTETVTELRSLVLAMVLATLVSTGLAVFGYASGSPVVVGEQAVETETETGPVRQVGGASQNATAAARMMLTGTAMAAVLALYLPRRRYLYVTATVVGLTGTLLAMSRSTSLVILVGVAWLLLKLRGHWRFPLIASGAVLAGIVVLALLPAFFWERVQELNSPSDDPTLGRRLGYHLVGLDLLAQRPLLGVGPENFRWHYLDFDYRFMPGRFMEARDLHNMYLSVTVETGLLGAGVFLALLASTLAGLSAVRRRAAGTELAIHAEALQFGLSLLLIGSLFGAVETNKVLWVVLGMAIAAGVVGRSAVAPLASAGDGR